MDPDNPPAQGKGAIDTSANESGKDVERWQRTAIAAFFRAEARGFAPGYELDDWLGAEREVSDAMTDATPSVLSAAERPVATVPPFDMGSMSTTNKSKSAQPAQTDAANPLAKTKRPTRTRKTKAGAQAQVGGAA